MCSVVMRQGYGEGVSPFLPCPLSRSSSFPAPFPLPSRLRPRLLHSLHLFLSTSLTLPRLAPAQASAGSPSTCRRARTPRSRLARPPTPPSASLCPSSPSRYSPLFPSFGPTFLPPFPVRSSPSLAPPLALATSSSPVRPPPREKHVCAPPRCLSSVLASERARQREEEREGALSGCARTRTRERERNDGMHEGASARGGAYRHTEGGGAQTATDCWIDRELEGEGERQRARGGGEGF